MSDTKDLAREAAEKAAKACAEFVGVEFTDGFRRIISKAIAPLEAELMVQRTRADFNFQSYIDRQAELARVRQERDELAALPKEWEGSGYSPQQTGRIVNLHRELQNEYQAAELKLAEHVEAERELLHLIDWPGVSADWQKLGVIREAAERLRKLREGIPPPPKEDK